jgi:hypothetical protein
MLTGIAIISSHREAQLRTLISLDTLQQERQQSRPMTVSRSDPAVAQNASYRLAIAELPQCDPQFTVFVYTDSLLLHVFGHLEVMPALKLETPVNS